MAAFKWANKDKKGITRLWLILNSYFTYKILAIRTLMQVPGKCIRNCSLQHFLSVPSFWGFSAKVVLLGSALTAILLWYFSITLSSFFPVWLSCFCDHFLSLWTMKFFNKRLLFTSMNREISKKKEENSFSFLFFQKINVALWSSCSEQEILCFWWTPSCQFTHFFNFSSGLAYPNL